MREIVASLSRSFTRPLGLARSSFPDAFSTRRFLRGRSAVLRAAAIALSLSACSQDQGSGPASADLGGFGPDGGASSADLSGPGSPADLGAYPESGYVYARSVNNTSGKFSSLVAAFYGQPYTSCTVMMSGACLIQTCPVSQPPPPFVSAGNLTLSGGARTITLMPRADKGYTVSSDGTQALWSGGEMLSFSATGADVPAFTASLVAPGPIAITSPTAPSGGGKLSVSRTSDLTMTWTGGGSAQFRGGITAVYNNGASSAAVVCTAPASAGSFTIPASLIGQLPQSPTSAGLFGASAAKKQVVSGSYAFTFDASFDANGPGNTSYLVQIQLN